MRIEHLRNVLAEQIELLRHKKTSPQIANAITNASGKIIASIRLEFDYARMIGRKPAIPTMDGEFKKLSSPKAAKKNGKANGHAK